MATQKKSALAKHNENKAKVATTAVKKPTKAPKAKPAKLDPALSAAKGVPTAEPKAKRTVAVPDIGLAGVPLHTVHDVAGLVKVLADFPRGSTYSTDIYQGMSWMKVYNLRGRLIAEVKRVDKPAKTARADKL